jgi:TM2 domain-containing membrane protein YozV
MDESGIATGLSLFVPGSGQFYNGDHLRGVFWLSVTPVVWIVTGGLFGWVCNLVAAFTAFKRANLHALGPA